MTTIDNYLIYKPKPIALIPPENNPPEVDAGTNVTISSSEQLSTFICGYAFDSDGDSLTYRWMYGNNELSGWQPIEQDGEACINLATINSFENGSHSLKLEVNDNTVISSDTMDLTIENSEPSVVPFGAGTYEINSQVTIGGQISDFDGDLIYFAWSEDTGIISSGSVRSTPGGEPVSIPDHFLSNLALGDHILTLSVRDGINPPAEKVITISIVDSTFPTLAPEVNKGILWPPNHKMIDIQVSANASDNSGEITLSANIFSSEPEEGLGDGDMYPDWTVPVINQSTGIITFQLRAERSGLSYGRVYTIKLSATDDSGNVSFADMEIVVSHDTRIK